MQHMIRYQKWLLKRVKDKSERGENELGYNFSSLEGDREKQGGLLHIDQSQLKTPQFTDKETEAQED